MKNQILVIDELSDLNLVEYPEFLDLAESERLTVMFVAAEDYLETIAEYGVQSISTLHMYPERYDQAVRLLFSFFVISLALSQHEQFRVTRSKWFGGLFTTYYSFHRNVPSASHYKMMADAYYRVALQRRELRWAQARQRSL